MHKPQWHKEPMVWLIIALPLTAVVAGLLTVWIAARNADTLVSEDHRKEGMATYQIDSRDRKAAELGVAAHLVSEGDRLTVHLNGRFDTPATGLNLALVHPTEAAADLHLALMPVAAGVYQGPLPALAAGKRRLILTSTAGDWRLAGDWQAPFSGELHLQARQPDSSTSP